MSRFACLRCPLLGALSAFGCVSVFGSLSLGERISVAALACLLLSSSPPSAQLLDGRYPLISVSFSAAQRCSTYIRSKTTTWPTGLARHSLVEHKQPHGHTVNQQPTPVRCATSHPHWRCRITSGKRRLRLVTDYCVSHARRHRTRYILPQIKARQHIVQRPCQGRGETGH